MSLAIAVMLCLLTIATHPLWRLPGAQGTENMKEAALHLGNFPLIHELPSAADQRGCGMIEIDETLFQNHRAEIAALYERLFGTAYEVHSGGDVQLSWQRAYVAAALAHAAAVAVNAGLTAEQFAGFAFKAYEQAHANAPRFG